MDSRCGGALPHGKRQMVGPFIFFDHFGPVQFVSGKGMDVRPHPHIGLATVTYLFDGSIMHRDSEGNIQEIQPGAMNLMTAGRGIAHSERTPDLQRQNGQKMLGLQSWIALPAGSEEIAPSFQHYAAADLPTVQERGFSARVIAGSSFWRRVAGGDGVAMVLHRSDRGTGRQRATRSRSRGARDLPGRRRGRDRGRPLRGAAPPDLPAGRPHHGEDPQAGADDVPRRRCAGRPAPYLVEFVSSSKERIEQAKQDWKTGRFAHVPNEHEFIPLPE